MYHLITSNKFEKDFKRCIKRNYSISIFNATVKHILATVSLPQQYVSHKLSNNYAGHWECHIKPDWLLIWLQDDIEQTITLVRTGTHSDLF